MRLSYLGHSCFRIRGSKQTVITDPYDKYIGFTMPKTKADIITLSHGHKDHAAVDRVDGEPFVISGPGEYEIQGVFVQGISSWHDHSQGSERGPNTIYTIDIDGFRLAHLGDLGEVLTDKKLDQIGDIDVLLIPVGGIYTIEAAQAIKLIEKIDPKIAVPMHFKTSRHTEAFAKLANLEEFVKLWEREATTLDVLNLKDYPMPEETDLVVLTAKT